MDLDNNAPYKVHHSYDISNIARRFSELDESIWYINTSRQAYGNGPHKHTTSIIINYCKGEPEIDKNKLLESMALNDSNYNHKIFNNYQSYEDFSDAVRKIEKRFVDEQLNNYTDEIVKDLEEKFDGIAGLVVYPRMPAQTNIGQHIDRGYYLKTVHRLHIPIVTNPDVYFLIGDTKFHMEEGRVYEINNQQRHGVSNSGDTQRIHLIVDIIPRNALPKDYETKIY